MKFNELISDNLSSSYAVCRIQHKEFDYLLVASEIEDACFAYDLNRDLKKSIIWDKPGGTMSIVQIPNSLDFLATQKFYPGFNAADCQIVHGKFVEGSWEITPLIQFPYLHRFDLLQQKDGQILFIGCTIANSKKSIDDWSDKGKIFVGSLSHEKKYLTNIKELSLRLTKNHGYYARKLDGYSLITATEGIVKLIYPEFSESGEWETKFISTEETSDIVQIDLDGDETLKNVVIQGFHGDQFRIFDQNFTEVLYRYPEATSFGHALWAGKLLSRNLIVFGWRDGSGELRVFEKKDNKLQSTLIGKEVSSSNVLAFEKDGQAYIFSANNGVNKVNLYQIIGG